MADLLTGLTPWRPANFEVWPSGAVYLSTGLGPVKKWNGRRSDFTNVGIETPTAAPTVGGSGSGSITGSYYAFVRYLDEDGVPGPPGPLSTVYAASGKGQIDYSSVPTPTDTAKVKRKQILRNTDGQAAVFYVDVDTTDTSDTTLTGTNTDAQLRLLGPDMVLPIYDEQGNDLTAAFGAPRDDKPILVRHRGRLFAAGSAEYAEGMAQVTNASATVTGVGTAWTTSLIGRLFEAAGYSVEISNVNATTQTITLASNWAGSTSKFQEYAVRPSYYDRATFFYSEADNPEGWDPSCGLAMTEAADNVTAMIDAQSYLWVCTPTQLHKFAYDDDPYLTGQCHPAVWRGCVNQRCWVRVGQSFYCLDRLGIYRLDGEDAQEVAEPIRDVFCPEALGEYKIDWTMEAFFHACHDAGRHAVRFFVSLSGPSLPRHCLVYDYARGSWSVEEYPFDVSASQILPGPLRRTVVLGPGLAPHQLGPSFGDGADLSGQAVVQAVASASPLSVTVSGLTPDVSSLVGTTVAVVGGRGVGQLRLISAFSSGRIEVDRPWSVLPDSTSTVLIGAVFYRLHTGAYDRTEGESNRTIVIEQRLSDNQFPRLAMDLDGIPVTFPGYSTLAADQDGVTWDGFKEGLPGSGLSLTLHPDRCTGRAFVSDPAPVEADNRSGQMISVELFGFCGREPYRLQSLTVREVEP